MKRHSRSMILPVVILLCFSTCANTGGSDTARPCDRGPCPLDVSEAWADSFDDLSHVYVPTGGLVGVEVTGGEVRLLPGSSEGWIASSIISCPPFMHYDLVLLEAIVPGNSAVLISILDPDEESTVVGFANESVPGYEKIEGTDISVYRLDQTTYPQIRVQVDLRSDGTDRPRLLGWSLSFTGFDEWTDDLLGTGKMSKSLGITVVEGSAGVDRSDGRLPAPYEYDAYPPLILTTYAYAGVSSMDLFDTNSSRTGYEDRETVQCRGTHGIAVADLDEDGYLDLVCANRKYSGEVHDSQILWGRSSGTWSQSKSKNLKTAESRDVAIGDFNGDGELDLFFATTSSKLGQVFLNRGGGQFGEEPDQSYLTRDMYSTDVVDWNNDGFDDVLVADKTLDQVDLLLGGPMGLKSSTTFYGGPTVDSPHAMDINLDGHLDLVCAGNADSGEYRGLIPVYLGDPTFTKNRNLNNADYLLPMTDDDCLFCAVGDINGDGHYELVYSTKTGTSNHLIYFEGTADGWKGSDMHVIDLPDRCQALEVFDVDKDGFDDILLGNDNDEFDLFYGGDYWPTRPNETRGCLDNPVGVAIVVPRRQTSGGYHGYFVSEPITLPVGKKWDMAILEAEVPEGTWAYMSLLDEDENPIMDLGSSQSTIDMYNLEDARTLRVKITIWSGSNTTTPALDRVSIKWIDENVWRDQFYGDSRAQTLRNLAIENGSLMGDTVQGDRPQIIITQYSGYPYTFFDEGGLNYVRDSAFGNLFGSYCSAVAVVDVNDDGLLDLVFGNKGWESQDFVWVSTIYLNSPVGFLADPDIQLPTVGTKDVLVEDLNGDGHCDIVFAQKMNTTTYRIDSTLFWGSSEGWNTTPDVYFTTTGADDVKAADLNGDGLLDLVFACYMSTTTSTDSMVFLQDSAGFCGTVPSYKLPTKGASGVAIADLDGDENLDIIFANGMAGGITEIDSYIYWGMSGGGFAPTPGRLPSVGAEDVVVDDLDNDGYLDVVFANCMSNTGNNSVDSYVYLNNGSGGFGTVPYARLRTPGAVSVIATDLDHSGWKDLAFACYQNNSKRTPSLVYLGGSGGWSARPDIELDTPGGTDIAIVNLFEPGAGAYISNKISIESPRDIDRFHTLGYTAYLGPAQSGTVYIVDASTRKVLFEKAAEPGTVEVPLEDNIIVKDHPEVQVMFYVKGLDDSASFQLDGVWINWSKRVRTPPVVLGVSADEPRLLRTRTTMLSVDVTDEYDSPDELVPSVQHRPNGTDTWSWNMVGAKTYKDGVWTMELTTWADIVTGQYDFRVLVRDTDLLESGWVEFPNVLEVLNNKPTAPEVRIMPQVPITSVSLRAEIVRYGMDVETPVTYQYAWYLDGILEEGLADDIVPSSLTKKGQNWSVEVRAFDGIDASPPALAWVVIANAPPGVGQPLPDPELEEDTFDDRWLDLSIGFSDPDGDPLDFALVNAPEHIQITIGPTGRVTLRPDADWCGQESATFSASDGELTATQTVVITVTPVDDVPWFTSINGAPFTTDPVNFDIMQGDALVITVGVQDVEGDMLAFSVNTTAVQVDERTGTITFQPGNDAVGTLRFALTMSETGHSDVKVRLNFTITVINANDPMDAPRIIAPRSGEAYKVNTTFSLIGACEDPDTVYGQVLNCSWWWNGTNLIGYGSSLTWSSTTAGSYIITLRVTDGEYTKEASAEVTIEPRETPLPPPPQEPPKEVGSVNALAWAGILVALVVVGGVLFVVTTRRRAVQLEAMDEVEEKREAFEHMAAEIRATTEELEREVTEARSTPPKPPEASQVVIETRGPGGEVTHATAAEMGTITMAPRETEAPSADVARLFKDLETGEPQVSAEDAEAMRLESLKRKYQTAIGRLPYGIPAPELKDREWTWLAGALANGQKKDTPDGRELTLIEGRWYYSDVKDASSFLKEHGARSKAEARRPTVQTMDRATLLEKLEERLILGEISEKTYKSLMEKYDKEL